MSNKDTKSLICEFCLEFIGTTSKRKEKEIRWKHAKLMNDHKEKCKMWNNNAAKVLKL